MLSRTAMRMPTVANTVARRGFSSTRMQLASPYHYPEGPRSNLPFNPLTKFFAVRFWGFMGEQALRYAPSALLPTNTTQPPVSSFPSALQVSQSPLPCPAQVRAYSQSHSLADQEEPIDASPRMHYLHAPGLETPLKTLAPSVGCI